MAETETFLINGRTLDTLTLEQLDALRALVIEEIDRRTVAPEMAAPPAALTPPNPPAIPSYAVGS